MTIAVAHALSLPGDRAWLDDVLTRPGGPSTLSTPEKSYLMRIVAGLDLVSLVSMAELAPNGQQLYQIWLDRHGNEPQASVIWYNFGVKRMAAGDTAGAAEAHGTALRLRPDLWSAALAQGIALEKLGLTDLALAALRRSLPPSEERIRLHNELGRMLEQEGRLAESAAEMRASLLINPDQPDLQQHLIHNRQRMAAWPVLDIAVPGIDQETAALHCGPLATLALVDDPLVHRAVAADWIARKVPEPGKHLAPAKGYQHDRIRLGYLSSDFCRHAMSFLITEVLERHDREKFEIFGYCASPEDGSDERARVIAAMDHHVRIREMDDDTAAHRILADEIDILIDLNGLTRGARLGILRLKPAPIQITYLGYIGPVPLPELDYILCDAITVPPEHDALYSPKPLRLPDCFQANDSRKPVLPIVSRAEESLPEDAFVFACFSNHYKVTQTMFSAWCRILHAVPRSVLWLVDDNPQSKAALQSRAQMAGIDPTRLIFAARVPPERYRARLALADLFLDTTPYNAGTVASDALRMGLPVLTLLGKSFAARMAASLLTRIGLTECIAENIENYIELAVAMGQDVERHRELRGKISEGAWQHTLGDVESFTHNLEATLQSVCLTGQGSVGYDAG